MQTSQQSKYDNVSNSLNRAMIPIKLAPLYLILSLLCFSAHSTATIQKPANIDARRYLFYNSTVTSMPNQQFNITFLIAFTGTPLFVYGIDEYKMNDRFDVQNFQSYSSVSSQTGFSIGVNSTGSTNVLTFSISYFATEQQISFLSDFQNVTYGLNISAFPGGTYNYRYYQATIPIAFNSSSVLAFPLLTGYYITSQTYFALNVTASVTNTTSYTFKVETGSNCAILRATFYLLFCQSTLMQANGYYSFGGINQVWSNNTINSASFTYSVYNYSQTAFLLGIRGFAGFTALNNCYWGWSTPNTTGNDMVTLTIWEKQLQFIYFSFFQIGKYITSNTTNTTTNSTNTTNVNTTNTTNSTNSSTNSTANQTYPPTSSSQAASFLPIIIGVVISIVIATIVVIVFLKFCWNKAITTLPTNAEFRQMPSISL